MFIFRHSFFSIFIPISTQILYLIFILPLRLSSPYLSRPSTIFLKGKNFSKSPVCLVKIYPPHTHRRDGHRVRARDSIDWNNVSNKHFIEHTFNVTLDYLLIYLLFFFLGTIIHFIPKSHRGTRHPIPEPIARAMRSQLQLPPSITSPVASRHKTRVWHRIWHIRTKQPQSIAVIPVMTYLIGCFKLS